MRQHVAHYVAMDATSLAAEIERLKKLQRQVNHHLSAATRARNEQGHRRRVQAPVSARNEAPDAVAVPVREVRTQACPAAGAR